MSCIGIVIYNKQIGVNNTKSQYCIFTINRTEWKGSENID